MGRTFLELNVRPMKEAEFQFRRVQPTRPGQPSRLDSLASILWSGDKRFTPEEFHMRKTQAFSLRLTPDLLREIRAVARQLERPSTHIVSTLKVA